MKNRNRTALLLGALAIASSLHASNCDCSNNVTNNYNEIREKVPSHFDETEQELEEIIEELEVTIQEKEREIELLNKTIENRMQIAVSHSREVSQLIELKEHIKAQNDAKLFSSKVEISKTQEALKDNMLEKEAESKPIWK